MKRNFLIILFSSICISAFADGYYTANLKLKIQTSEGKTIIGYSSFSPNYLLDKDSILSTNYLMKQLSSKNILNYFSNRLTYEYKYPREKEKRIFIDLNPKQLSISKIKSLEIIENILTSSYVGVSNQLELMDSSWINSDIIEIIEVEGEYCSYDIFIHEKNPKLNELIKNLEKQVQKFFNAITLEENLELVVLNKKMDILFDEISKFKAVVISTCVE